MTTAKEVKTFDSVTFFRTIKEKMAKMPEGISLAEKKKFMQEIGEDKNKAGKDLVGRHGIKLMIKSWQIVLYPY